MGEMEHGESGVYVGYLEHVSRLETIKGGMTIQIENAGDGVLGDCESGGQCREKLCAACVLPKLLSPNQTKSQPKCKLPPQNPKWELCAVPRFVLRTEFLSWGLVM